MQLKPSNDFEPLTSGSLLVRLNYWTLTHFSTIRRTAIYALSVASALLYGWSAWQALPIIEDPGLVDRIYREVAAMQPYVAPGPEPLEVGEVSAVVLPGSTHLLATVTNPNEDRVATGVGYEFRQPGGDVVASGWLWLMPGETRYAAGVAAGEAADAELAILGTRWARDHEADPMLALQLAAKDVALQYESGQPSRATFTVVNNDLVGYRSVTAIAVARSGGSVVAVAKLEIGNLAAGEERPSAVTWYHPVPAGSQVEVQLVTDPFSRTNVLLPQ